MNTASLIFELDRNSLWKLGLWHLSWVRNHSTGSCLGRPPPPFTPDKQFINKETGERSVADCLYVEGVSRV
jgi:hypothetical protein